MSVFVKHSKFSLIFRALDTHFTLLMTGLLLCACTTIPVDEGYDLSLPYGIGVTYAHVNQDMLLSEFEAGINGRDREPFAFVAFDDANAENGTWQLEIDAWLFQFMNVFALLGKIGGEANLDVLLDGNGMLVQLDATCGGFPPNPI